MGLAEDPKEMAKRLKRVAHKFREIVARLPAGRFFVISPTEVNEEGVENMLCKATNVSLGTMVDILLVLKIAAPPSDGGGITIRENDLDNFISRYNQKNKTKLCKRVFKINKNHGIPGVPNRPKLFWISCGEATKHNKVAQHPAIELVTRPGSAPVPVTPTTARASGNSTLSDNIITEDLSLLLG